MTSNPAERTLDGKLVVLLGGNGFVGLHLAQQLLARGARLRIASRNPERAFRLKPLGNLGQVQFVRCDITNAESVARALSGADALVNLVGIFAGELDAVQGAGLGQVAAAARTAGLSALVHVSANGADPDSPSAYGRSKAAGEAAILAEFPSATIVRPSVLFGPDDQFLNLFAKLIALLPVVPVFGPDKRLQPLFVDDAALAIAAVLGDPARHGGKVYELGGPEALTMLELHQRIAAAQGRKGRFVPLPDVASATFATATGWLPFAPLSRDQWRMLAAGNVLSGNLPGTAALGIDPRPLALFLDRWMVQYRTHGRFGATSVAHSL